MLPCRKTIDESEILSYLHDLDLPSTYAEAISRIDLASHEFTSDVEFVNYELLSAANLLIQFVTAMRRGDLANSYAAIRHAESSLATLEQNSSLRYSSLRGVVFDLARYHPRPLAASAGFIFKEESCSICGQDPRLCEHIPGRLYAGRYCFLTVSQAELLEVSLVRNPAQPECMLTQFAGRKLPYGLFPDHAEVEFFRQFLLHVEHFDELPALRGLRVLGIGMTDPCYCGRPSALGGCHGKWVVLWFERTFVVSQQVHRLDDGLALELVYATILEQRRLEDSRPTPSIESRK